MTIDLKSMSRKELEKLLSDVQKALKTAAERDRREARKAAQKAAAEYGFSLDDFTETAEKTAKGPKKTRKKRGPSKPKYANPADSSQTWTGKGRQPNWYREEIAAGKLPAQMEI